MNAAKVGERLAKQVADRRKMIQSGASPRDIVSADAVKPTADSPARKR